MNRKFLTFPAALAIAAGALFGTAGSANAVAPTPNTSATTQGIGDWYIYGHPTVRVGSACPPSYKTGFVNQYYWKLTGSTRTTCSYRAYDAETGWYIHSTWSKR